MFEIVKKEALNPTVMRMDIKAPLVAKKARAGQFVILRADMVLAVLPFVFGCASVFRSPSRDVIWKRGPLPLSFRLSAEQR